MGRRGRNETVNIIPFPGAVDCEHIEYPFPDGAKLTLDAGDRPLTVENAIFMLDYIKHIIMEGMVSK